MNTLTRDPFRLFFPLGTLLLLLGIVLWVPRIWDAEAYPVLLHRALVLNGFMTCFIGGFLMTAVPRFSQTEFAVKEEVFLFLFLVLAGILSAYFDREKAVFIFSSLSALFLLVFLIRRMKKRKANPPYSFIFIFVGLFLWAISGILSMTSGEEMKELHYHGAIMAIILGVGGRLLPGIMGHTEIVSAQRKVYEQPVPLYKTIPVPFAVLVALYVFSFFLPETPRFALSALVVTVVGMVFWRLWKLPVERTALTICLWIAGWLIVLSYILRAFWTEGMIHAGHGFFINGMVLLSLLIATRVIQSHGPQDKSLENWKGLYVMTVLLFLASVTRVTAYLLPQQYLSHLGYASILLILAVFVWVIKYLRFVRVVPS